MATVTKELKQQTTFTRINKGKVESLTLPKGKKYEYECSHTDTECIHVATYVDGEGNVWVKRQKTPLPSKVEPKQKYVITPSAPINLMTMAVVEQQEKELREIIAQTPTPPMVVTPEVPGAMQVTSTVVEQGSTQATADSVITRMMGKGDSESQIRQLTRLLDDISGGLVQLNYYHPTSLKIPNPSKIFRRHAYRLDGSNWVFTCKSLQHKDVQRVLKSWDAYCVPQDDDTVFSADLDVVDDKEYADYWDSPYTQETINRMKEAAQVKLAKKLKREHRKLILAIDKADQKLQDAQDALDHIPTQKDNDALIGEHTIAIRKAVRDACEEFESCLKGAEVFDDTGKLDPLFASIKTAMRIQAVAVNATLRARRVKLVIIPSSIGA